MRWFELYPVGRRKDQIKTEREWRRLQRTGRLPPLPELLAVLERQKRSPEWEREEGRMVPLPWRYLAQGRFVDASVTPAREPPAECVKCRGSGYRRAQPGEPGIGGQVVCECKAEEEVRGP